MTNNTKFQGYENFFKKDEFVIVILCEYKDWNLDLIPTYLVTKMLSLLNIIPSILKKKKLISEEEFDKKKNKSNFESQNYFLKKYD